MGFRLPGWSPFEKNGNPIRKKYKEFKEWKKQQHSKHNIIEATVPDIPIGPGGSAKLLKTFSKIAKKRGIMSKRIEKLLKKKGYTFKKK